MSAKDFESIGVPLPRRTFLDKGTPSSYSAAPPPLPTPQHSQTPRHPRGNTAHSSLTARGGGGPAVAAVDLGTDGALRSAVDTKAVVLAEHRIELLDMLQEATALLKNIYRSKFIFGAAQLSRVDPSAPGDGVGQFNLATPPVFDRAYGLPNPELPEDDGEGAVKLQSGADSGHPEQRQQGAAQDRLRVAEELIRKLYRRNTQLEVENKYVKGEIVKLERLRGLSRTGSHSLAITDGHIPLDHPLYTKKMQRHCRSVPPQRTLLRTAVGGFGLSFPSRTAQHDDPVQVKEDPLPVAQLKRRVLELTEALMAVQHQNESLLLERNERITANDRLLTQYLAERDQQIAALHAIVLELIAKVQNPLKLARAKQPALSVNPVVAHQNVLREVSQRLSEQIAAIAGDIVKQTARVVPTTTDGGLIAATPLRTPAAETTEEAGGVVGEGTGSRRKELSRRLRHIVDTLPVTKRKQLLILMTELRELYVALVKHSQAISEARDQLAARSHAESVQLKTQVALLRDQLRSMGVEEDGIMTAANALGAMDDNVKPDP